METTPTRARRALLIGMWTLILALSAGADDSTDTVITGSIVGQDGKPQAGVTVEARDEKYFNELVTSVVTDGHGGFRIEMQGVHRCTLTFKHPDNEESRYALVECEGLPLYPPAGGVLDLGRLTLAWTGGEIHACTTFEGAPVPSVKLKTGPRVNQEPPVTTGVDGTAQWSHRKKAGERIVLFADDGKDLTGWFVGEVKAAGEAVEAPIELVRGKGTVSCRMADLKGRAVARGGKVYLAPVCAEDQDSRIFPKETFLFDLSWCVADLKTDGTCEIADVPPGKWYVTAVLDGVMLHPNGVPGTAIEVKPNGRAAVSFPMPARTGGVQGQVNYSIIGHSLAEIGAERLDHGQKRSQVAVFLIPSRADRRFFLVPFTPVVVVDLLKTTKFEVKGIPEGDYLAFAGGVRRWPNPEELPDEWMLVRGVAPTMALGRVRVRADAVTTLDFVGEMTAAETARRYHEPLQTVEGFLAYLKNNWK